MSFLAAFTQDIAPYQRKKWSIFTILLFHIAGLPFLAYPPTRELFLLATPFTLLLSNILLLWNHSDWNRSFYFFAALCFCVGMFFEILGVKTGAIFGGYHYGEVLGIKFMEVPLMIGVNWLLCIYCCGVIGLRLPFSKPLKAALAATLMVAIDYVIEPVAIKMGFWEWHSEHIPLQNYLAWYLISLGLLLTYYYLPFQKENKVAPILYITLFLFFFILGFAPS